VTNLFFPRTGHGGFAFLKRLSFGFQYLIAWRWAKSSGCLGRRERVKLLHKHKYGWGFLNFQKSLLGLIRFRILYSN
jgi:hypothetical protein